MCDPTVCFFFFVVVGGGGGGGEFEFEFSMAYLYGITRAEGKGVSFAASIRPRAIATANVPFHSTKLH